MKKQLTLVVFLLFMVSSYAQNEELNDAFLDAVEESNFEEVEKLLAKGAEVNAKSYNGNNAGEYAIWSIDESDEMITFLLDNGLDPTITNLDDENLLHIAAEYEGNSIIPRLVTLGCPINAKNSDGYTPVLIAAENSDFEAVKTLVAQGADLSIVDEDGKGIVQYLDLEEKDHWSLLVSLELPQEQLNATLIKCLDDLEDVEKFSILLDKGADPNTKDSDNTPAIMLAADFEDPAFLDLIINKGADVNAVDDDGYSALWSFYDQAHLSLLIEAGIDVNLNNDGESPLLELIYLADKEGVQALLKAGADPKMKVGEWNASSYCKYLLSLDDAPGAKYKGPARQEAFNKEYKSKIKEIAQLVK